MSSYWLGFDTGTGGTRALLIDAHGKEIAAVTAPHEEIRMEHPLWAEQRPENWSDAAAQAIRGVLAESGVNRPATYGASASPARCTAWSFSTAPARSSAPPSSGAISAASLRSISSTRPSGRRKSSNAIANPVLTGFTLPKLLWVRDHEPQHFERVRKLLLPKDYVRFRLTGEFATEVSDASGTALLDVVRRRWSFDMMDSLGLDRDILPSVHESTDITGVISSQPRELTGLATGTPVVGGGGDQAASAVGNGIVEPGIVSCTLGTSGVVFAHTDKAA